MAPYGAALPLARSADQRSGNDFTAYPVASFEKDALLSWFCSRRMPSPGNTTRQTLTESVRVVTAQGAQGPKVLPVNSFVGSGRYMSTEPLSVDGAVPWVTDGDAVLAELRGLQIVTRDLLGLLLGSRGLNGTRPWGFVRFVSGAYQLSTFRCAKTKDRATGKVVTVFDIEVTPSMTWSLANMGTKCRHHPGAVAVPTVCFSART